METFCVNAFRKRVGHPGVELRAVTGAGRALERTVTEPAFSLNDGMDSSLDSIGI